MLTIVGLGNPGAAYRKSRHNTGFMLVDGIAEGRFLSNVRFHRSDINILRRLFERNRAFKKKSTPYVIHEGELFGKRFCLVKPLTFMNESGKALVHIKRRGIIKNLEELIVIVDDVDLEIGRIRLRARGSAGGHNGLKSIISSLGTKEFARLRVGIGPRPNGEQLLHYVLGTFSSEEKNKLEKSFCVAATLVEAWITGGFENAQNIMLSL